MNERIKCENCIYWDDDGSEDANCLLQVMPNVKGGNFWLNLTYRTEYCGHFIDKETNKSYRDLYFEEKGIKKYNLDDIWVSRNNIEHPVQTAIYNYIKDNEPVTATLRDIAKYIKLEGRSPQKIKHHLIQLMKAGKIKRTGIRTYEIHGKDEG